MTSTKEQRTAIAARLKEWWEDNKGGFRPLYIRHQTANKVRGPAKPKNRTEEWVAKLSDVNAGVSSGATNQLRRLGDKAIDALINRGLVSTDGITRNRARDLLREITGQNFAFEGIRGNQAARNTAIEQWRGWAQANGHIPGIGN